MGPCYICICQTDLARANFLNLLPTQVSYGSVRMSLSRWSRILLFCVKTTTKVTLSRGIWSLQAVPFALGRVEVYGLSGKDVLPHIDCLVSMNERRKGAQWQIQITCRVVYLGTLQAAAHLISWNTRWSGRRAKQVYPARVHDRATLYLNQCTLRPSVCLEEPEIPQQ